LRQTGGNRSWRNFSCGNNWLFRGGDVAAKKSGCHGLAEKFPQICHRAVRFGYDFIPYG
jgi:hypothetical protein